MTQKYLDNIAKKPEANYLLNEVEGWCSHRPLLYLALEMTKSSNKPIVELGCGYGSTTQLNQYIQTDKRKLISFDTNQEWLNKFIHLQSNKHEFVYKPDNFAYNQESQEWYDKTPEIVDWLTDVSKDGISVCLVDHACGERRHSDIKLIHENCDFMIIHDSQPPATGYMMDKIWGLFKYKLNMKKWGDWATIVSNKHDVTKFDGMKIGNFEVNI
jgi:hypothetical protein